MKKFRIRLIATGGTFAKAYDAHAGRLVVDNRVVDRALADLTLPDFELQTTDLMARDSLEMDDDDRQAILAAVGASCHQADAVVVIHGTDTLCRTSALLAANLPDLPVPVVFTGAMVPYGCVGSAAGQNLAQALAACRLLPPGVHIAFHGRCLDGANAVKNYDTLTFEAAN